jgi:Icc-related predicted phosphoesterase
MRILAVADAVSPMIYSENFPGNLPPFDLILSAGDFPGHVLEFMATKQTLQPVYVLGNHGDAYIRDAQTDEVRLPGGCINAHMKVIDYKGLLIAGIEGSGKYRPGNHQYTESQYSWMVNRLSVKLAFNKLTKGRGLDILLTHAAPKGPHEGEDFPHRGIPAFNRLIENWKPKLHVHGHVHLNGVNAPREYTTESGVRVVNAFEFTMIEMDF